MTAFLIDHNMEDTIAIALNNPISAIVRPYSDNSDQIEKNLRELTDAITGFEKRVHKIVATGNKTRSELSETFATSDLNEQMFDNLNKFIEQTETGSLSFAQAFSKNAKFIKSFQIKMKKSKPKFAERFQKQFVRLKSAQLAFLDEYSEMSLFLRALRAKYNPHRQLSKPFTNEHDLERYLNNLIA